MKLYKRIFHLPTCALFSLESVSGVKELSCFLMGQEGAGTEKLPPPHPLLPPASKISRYISFCTPQGLPQEKIVLRV